MHSFHPGFLPGSPSHPLSLVIEVPPKICRPKPVNTYSKTDYTPNDVDEDLYLFPSYGRGAIFRPTVNPFDFSIRRTDRILWDAKLHQAEFDADSLSSTHRTSLTQIIQEHWDSFTSAGVNRPVLNYEFCIDTGSPNPVACRQVR